MNNLRERPNVSVSGRRGYAARKKRRAAPLDTINHQDSIQEIVPSSMLGFLERDRWARWSLWMEMLSTP